MSLGSPRTFVDCQRLLRTGTLLGLLIAMVGFNVVMGFGTVTRGVLSLGVCSFGLSSSIVVVEFFIETTVAAATTVVATVAAATAAVAAATDTAIAATAAGAIGTLGDDRFGSDGRMKHISKSSYVRCRVIIGYLVTVRTSPTTASTRSIINIRIAFTIARFPRHGSRISSIQ